MLFSVLSIILLTSKRLQRIKMIIQPFLFCKEHQLAIYLPELLAMRIFFSLILPFFCIVNVMGILMDCSLLAVMHITSTIIDTYSSRAWVVCSHPGLRLGVNHNNIEWYFADVDLLEVILVKLSIWFMLNRYGFLNQSVRLLLGRVLFDVNHPLYYRERLHLYIL